MALIHRNVDRHNEMSGEFDVEEFARLLGEAAGQLRAAADEAKRAVTKGAFGLDHVRTSVWRVTKSLQELTKVANQIGQPHAAAGLQESAKRLDRLVEELSKV